MFEYGFYSNRPSSSMVDPESKVAYFRCIHMEQHSAQKHRPFLIHKRFRAFAVTGNGIDLHVEQVKEYRSFSYLILFIFWKSLFFISDSRFKVKIERLH